MEFDINDIASIGSVQDVPAYMLPPEAWTLALNIRYVDDGLEALDGWVQVFGDPLFAPHFAMPVVTSATNFWLYTSLAKAVGYDGTTHTDITRISGDYTASDSYQWNGTMLGGIAILNNGVDVPQFWATASLATKLADLTNWQAAVRAKVIRSFGPFLVAFSITDTAVEYPHRVRWSHPADPGTVPTSWDVTDPTKDTGEVDLPDVLSGVIQDALPLGSNMFIYKDASVWRMRYIGGQQIFDFGQGAWLTTAGLLGPRCVCISGDGTKHVLATQDDIIWHNGSTVQSILNKKQRRRLQNEIDTSNFYQSFIFANPFNNEIWFCYPQSGSTYPDKALILNYRAAGGEQFTVTEADGITFRNASVGPIEGSAMEIWDSGTDIWDDDTGPWATQERRRVVLSSPAAVKLFKLGGSPTRDGLAFLTTLRREGLALIGKKRDGSLIVDHERMKLFKRLWPKITGGTVNMRFGSQQFVNGPVTWGSAVDYNPEVQNFADPGPISGRAVGFEMSRTGAWRIDGYKIDMSPMGNF